MYNYRYGYPIYLKEIILFQKPILFQLSNSIQLSGRLAPDITLIRKDISLNRTIAFAATILHRRFSLVSERYNVLKVA